ncbi:hypothetical protein [Corynebacterium sp. 335C]
MPATTPPGPPGPGWSGPHEPRPWGNPQQPPNIPPHHPDANPHPGRHAGGFGAPQPGPYPGARHGGPAPHPQLPPGPPPFADGAHVPHGPYGAPLPPAPPRRRGSGCLAAAVGLVVIGAVTIGLMLLVGLFTGTTTSPTPVVRPGAPYVNDDAGSTCTLGFLGEDAEGRLGFLTAGHCGSVGDEVSVDTLLGPRVIGRFTVARDDGMTIQDLDLGFIALDDPSLADASILGVDRAPGDVAELPELTAESPELCFSGQMSGVACGAWGGVPGAPWYVSDVALRVPAIEGDSGSPVWAEAPDGTLVAVGILAGTGVDDEGESYAELISGPAAAELGLRVTGS